MPTLNSTPSATSNKNLNRAPCHVRERSHDGRLVVGYVRVSTDKQADRGVSLDAQAEKIRAMAVVHNAELLDIIVDGGESAKSLNRPGMVRLLALVDAKKVQTGHHREARPAHPERE